LLDHHFITPTEQWLVSPDGQWSADRLLTRIRVYRLTDPFGHRTATIESDTRKHLTDLAFHPSGRYLAATSNDKTVKLYDTATWNVARSFTWNVGRVRSVCFSPDGTLAAAGGENGQIVVWDVDL
jgi:WD40 repeat protein